MDEKEFLLRMEEIDKDLAQERLPVRARVFEAFPRLVPGYDGPLFGYGVDPSEYPEYEGPNLFEKVNDWYEKRYGTRFHITPYIARVPVIIREQVYLIRMPIAYGRPTIRVLRFVEGLTDGVMKSLNTTELTHVGEAFRDGFALTYELESLKYRLDPAGASPLPFSIARILEQAIQDRDAAVNCLDERNDTNGACFNAQQHAEKMMKGFLLSQNLYTEGQLRKSPFGHNLQAIFNACLQASGKFANATSDIGLLRGIPMKLRYSMAKVPIRVAVDTIWAALRVGGLCGCEIASIARRYGNPKSGKLHPIAKR